MKEEKVSIIIPVYKVEKYLNACIDSVLNQTYKNLEIILVDDGSPDNSGKMCDEFAKKDKRIKVIHKENAGSSSARNTGIDNSTGEYIVFYDSDDFIPEDSVKNLYEECKKNKADMAVCGFVKLKNSKTLFKSKSKITILDKKESLKNFFREEFFNCAVWNKIIKKELIGDVRFNTNMTVAEDFEFLYQLLKKINRVAINTEKLVYHYEIRSGSVMQGRFNEKNKKEVEVCADILEEVKKEYPDLENDAIRRYQRAIISCMSKCLKETGKIKDVENMLDELKKYHLQVKGYNKIRAYMLLYCKWMLKAIYKIYDKI